MKTPIFAVILGLTLIAGPGCSTKPAPPPAPTPLTLSYDEQSFLTEMNKLQLQLSEKVTNPYTKAEADARHYFVPQAPQKERMKNAKEIANQLDSIAQEIVKIQKTTRLLTPPPRCVNLYAHYQQYLDSLLAEAQALQKVSTICAEEVPPKNPEYGPATQRFQKIAISRNDLQMEVTRNFSQFAGANMDPAH